MLKKLVSGMVLVAFLSGMLPVISAFGIDEDDLIVQLLKTNQPYEVSSQVVATLVSSTQGQRPYKVADISDQNVSKFSDQLIAINTSLSGQKDLLQKNLLTFSTFAKTNASIVDVLLARYAIGIEKLTSKTIDTTSFPNLAKMIKDEMYSVTFYINLLTECNKTLKDMNISTNPIYSVQDTKLVLNSNATQLYPLSEIILDSKDSTLLKKILEEVTVKINDPALDGERTLWVNLLKEMSLVGESAKENSSDDAEYDALLQKVGYVITPASMIVDTNANLLDENKTDTDKAALVKGLMTQAGTLKLENTGGSTFGESRMTSIVEDMLKLGVLNAKKCAQLLSQKGYTVPTSYELTLDASSLSKVFENDIVIASSFVKKADSYSVNSFNVKCQYGTLVIKLSRFANQVSDNGVLNITFAQKNAKQLDKEVVEQAGNNELLLVSILSDGNEISSLTDDGAVQVMLNVAPISRSISPDEIQAISDEGIKKPAVGVKLEGGNLAFNVGKESYYTTILRFTSEGSISFSDLPTSHWAKPFVDKLVENKVLNGVGEGKFNPDGNVTREQFATMLVQAFKLKDESAVTNFSDVNTSAWYAVYVASAQKKEIINGVGNNQFGVGQKITRQDMSVMLERAANTANVQIKEINASITFSDGNEISSYATGSVSKMQKAGIISGLGDNRFAPKEYATRAQAAKMLYKLLY